MATAEDRMKQLEGLFSPLPIPVRAHPQVKAVYEFTKRQIEEIDRLQRDCGEAYQVVGTAMFHPDGGKPPKYTQEDVERVMDNLSDAACGEPRSHEDLLPWPKPKMNNKEAP